MRAPYRTSKHSKHCPHAMQKLTTRTLDFPISATGHQLTTDEKDNPIFREYFLCCFLRKTDGMLVSIFSYSIDHWCRSSHDTIQGAHNRPRKLENDSATEGLTIREITFAYFAAYSLAKKRRLQFASLHVHQNRLTCE